MKRVNRFLIVSLFLCLFGCASREDAIILDNKTASLERQLSILRDSNRDSNEEIKATLSRRIDQAEKKMDSLLQPVHQIQANTTTQIEALKTQIQDLQGRIEAFEYSHKRDQNRLTESFVKELKEMETRLKRLEQPPPPPSPPPPPPAEQEPAPEKAKETPQVSPGGPKENKEPTKEKEKTKAVPEDIFEAAETLFKKQAFEGAQKKYEEYLKTAPKGKFVEEARFGLAESFFGQKDYEEAILTYQKLIKAYPKSKFVPPALYKQALSFISLKDTGSARLLLEKIVKSYPKSSQAKLAQKKLKSL